MRDHGTLRVLFDLTGFHGWTAGALWSDTKFAVHHFRVCFGNRSVNSIILLDTND